MHAVCDSMLIALAFIADGRLSTLLKCFSHLSNIASLSVRGVLPAGWLQNSSGHKPFSVHHGTSSCPFGLQKTGFFLLLAHPGVLYVPEPVLDSLTTIAVGGLIGYKTSIILMCLMQSVIFFQMRLTFFIILVKPVLVIAKWMS